MTLRLKNWNKHLNINKHSNIIKILNFSHVRNFNFWDHFWNHVWEDAVRSRPNYGRQKHQILPIYKVRTVQKRVSRCHRLADFRQGLLRYESSDDLQNYFWPMQSELVENTKAEQSSAPLEIQEKLKSEIKSCGKIGEDLRWLGECRLSLPTPQDFDPMQTQRVPPFLLFWDFSFWLRLRFKSPLLRQYSCSGHCRG